MALGHDEITNIAHLARLKIEENKVDDYAQNLSNILDLVAQMNNANTDNIRPMAHPMDATQRLRNDEVTEADQRDHFQENAPATEDGLFLVPKVID